MIFYCFSFFGFSISLILKISFSIYFIQKVVNYTGFSLSNRVLLLLLLENCFSQFMAKKPSNIKFFSKSDHTIEFFLLVSSKV